MRKKILIGLLATILLISSSPAIAQQPAQVHSIGILSSGSALTYSGWIDSFRHGLRERGYVEGKNILLEYRYAEGKRERFSALAAEMVQLKPEVIVV